MKLQVENSIWHAFNYLSMENGKQFANKSKLKVMIYIDDSESELLIKIWYDLENDSNV